MPDLKLVLKNTTNQRNGKFSYLHAMYYEQERGEVKNIPKSWHLQKVCYLCKTKSLSQLHSLLCSSDKLNQYFIKGGQ